MKHTISLSGSVLLCVQPARGGLEA
jgi:hypothetical protein